MSGHEARRWFGIFCSAIGCTDAFRDSLHAQLERQFRERTGLPFDRFVLVPPPEGVDAVGFDPGGGARLDTELAGADGYSFPVSIGWRIAGAGRPLPSDPAAGAGGREIEAWWSDLPADELRAQYGSGDGPPWPASDSFPLDESRYSFELGWEPFPWPDLRIRVETGAPLPGDGVADIVDRLENAREAWNARSGQGAALGLIHNLGARPELHGPRALLVDVDFGSAPPAALLELLDALEGAAKDLDIRKVVVRGP